MAYRHVTIRCIRRVLGFWVALHSSKEWETDHISGAYARLRRFKASPSSIQFREIPTANAAIQSDLKIQIFVRIGPETNRETSPSS